MERNAIICGSTQGIGLATTNELALLGANCTLIARNKEALITAVKGLDTKQGQRHQHLVADFNFPEQVKSAIEKFVKNTTAHILINNSGGLCPG